MSDYHQAVIESTVFGVLKALPKSALLPCEAAAEIAFTLLQGVPESIGVVSKIGDFCRQEDIALLTIVLPHMASDLVRWDGPGKLELHDAANRGATLQNTLNRHPRYASYRNNLNSLSSDRVAELASGFHRLQTFSEQLMFARRNPQVLSSGIDFLLANSAVAAHADKEYGIENNFMQTRMGLVRVKEQV